MSPAFPTSSTATSTSTPGSLSDLCGSQQGILQLLEDAAAGKVREGFNVTVPPNLANSASEDDIAKVW